MRLLAALLLSAACADAATTPSFDAGPARGAYPAEPHGTVEGAVIAPLAFSLPDGAPRTLEDVWRDGSARLLLLVTAAGWCTACLEEQGALRGLHDAWAPAGLVILEAVFEDSSFGPATPELAGAWKRQHALPFDVVSDAPNRLGAYYDDALAPMNMFVDVGEMKILRVSTGYDANAVEAVIRGRLE